MNNFVTIGLGLLAIIVAVAVTVKYYKKWKSQGTKTGENKPKDSNKSDWS